MDVYAAHCAFKGKALHQMFTPLAKNGMGMHVKSQTKNSLHVVYLGAGMHIGGDILCLLCYTGILPGSPSDNMAQVWEEVQQ